MRLCIERQFIVDVPLEQAWDHLARIEDWPSWAKHIKSVKVDPPGDLCPSTAGVFHLANGGKARFVMTEFVPKTNWKWNSNFLGLPIHYDHRFESIAHAQTKMQFIIEANNLGLVKFVLGKIFSVIYCMSLDKAIPKLVAEMNAAKTEKG